MNRRSLNYSTTTILYIVVFAHLHCKKEEGLDIVQHLGNSFLFFLITLHISSPRLPKHSIALPTGHIIISVFLFSLNIQRYTAQIFFSSHIHFVVLLICSSAFIILLISLMGLIKHLSVCVSVFFI